jgi:hypothetical protein
MTIEREEPNRGPDLGKDVDLEQALAAYLADERMTRRQLLERIAAVGAAAALAPVIAACAAAPARPNTGSAPRIEPGSAGPVPAALPEIVPAAAPAQAATASSHVISRILARIVSRG